MERSFAPIEEFTGFDEQATIDDVVDGILKYGPGVIPKEGDVFYKTQYEIEMSVRAHLIGLGLAWSPDDAKDPVLSRRHEAADILFDLR